MNNKDKSTEEQILIAARKVFTEKGMDGARMQEIADLAGINKALLHYYFRSKERLFEAIFIEAFSRFFQKLMDILKTEQSIMFKMSSIVDHYLDILIQNPFLPIFILNEVNRDPARMQNMMKSSGFNPLEIEKFMAEMQSKGILSSFDSRHTIINLISLSVFPHLSKAIMKPLFFADNDELWNKFMKERKDIILKVLMQ
jgi:TetR/AcrR family transcriptional regulator